MRLVSYNKVSPSKIIDHSLTETGSEPLTLQQVKDHLKVTFIDEDTYITDLITACRLALEEYCQISIIAKTAIIYLDIYEERPLPFGPVNTFTSAEYKTGTGTYVTQTSNTDYEIDGTAFKTFKPFIPGRWRLTYTTGYTTAPPSLLLDLRRIIGYVYDNRGDEPKTNSRVEQAAKIDEALELFAGRHVNKDWTI